MRVDGEWRPVVDREMDRALVVDRDPAPPAVETRVLNAVEAGGMVVTDVGMFLPRLAEAVPDG